MRLIKISEPFLPSEEAFMLEWISKLKPGWDYYVKQIQSKFYVYRSVNQQHDIDEYNLHNPKTGKFTSTAKPCNYIELRLIHKTPNANLKQAVLTDSGIKLVDVCH